MVDSSPHLLCSRCCFPRWGVSVTMLCVNFRSGNKVVCSVKSNLTNLDFTRNNVTQKSLGNSNNPNKADEERARPNYMTGETCRKHRGCAPCDKNLTDPKQDGCLVPMKTGPEDWFGLTTAKVLFLFLFLSSFISWMLDLLFFVLVSWLCKK